MKEIETYKALIALNISFGCIKREILKDITETLSVVNKAKHKNNKTIKRRNTRLETIYSSLNTKKFFWLDLIFMKKNLDLIEIHTESDVDLMDKTINYLNSMLTGNLKFYKVEKEWKVKRIQNQKRRLVDLDLEYEFITKRSVLN